jgi:hypothetical protein
MSYFAARLFPNRSWFVRSAASLLDMRDVTDDPIGAAKLAGSRPFLIEVSLSDCRNRKGFPYSKDGPHPFVRTARAYAEGHVNSYQESPLQQYYDHYQPKNAAEALALPGDPSPMLLAAPPYGVVVPWEGRALADARNRCDQTAKRESRAHGANLLLEHGTSGVGPVSLEKGVLEFSRLARLVDGIRANGYVRSNKPDGDIVVKPLLWDDQGFRFVLKVGKHRAAVLAALGFDRIPVRMKFGKVAKMENVDQWPHVRDGLFSPAQALELFRRIWEGEPPPNAVPPSWMGIGG